MFDIKKMMDAIKDASQMQQQIQEELKNEVVEGSAGGGMVTAKMNGHFELMDIHIEASVYQMNDPAFLQDMVKAAVNDASKKARELLAEKMKSLSGRLGLPGGMPFGS
jgi:DNA-binding YbaB/EbfC family protein